MNRRRFIESTSLLSIATILTPTILMAVGKEDPVILIVSGWQDVNIGDIAHTPGLIGLLKQHIPKAKLILWKKSKSQMVEDMLHKHYPDLQIINGKFDTSDEVKQVFIQADFFIHGCGPSLIAADFLASWHKETQKPFGIFGVTIGEVSSSSLFILQKASFIFTRETSSLEVLKKAGLTGNHIAFAPDATFVLKIHDAVKANQYMDANKLEHRKFICVIPRLRKTPYHKIKTNNAGWSPERIKEVEELNDKYKEMDHAKLREAMIAWVRKTNNKIVVCPEMTYQTNIMDELLINPLPDDVKPFIVKHGYWLPDEAASLYSHATAVLSFECHSPIIAAANGTPGFYLRQPEDTIKGQMYYDLGLKDWTFEINETTGQHITDSLMQVHDHYKLAILNVKKAVAKVEKQYDQAFKILTDKFDIA